MTAIFVLSLSETNLLSDMITFKAIIVPGNRRKDGTYPVNIRVTYMQKRIGH